jgi:hypothetical protein
MEPTAIRQEIYGTNHQKLNNMKKIITICVSFILFLWLVMFMSSCTPVRVIETTTTDSTGKQIKIKTKYYQQSEGYSVPQASVNVVTTPVIYGGLYYPFIAPRIIVPVGPRVYYRPSYRRH